MSRDEVLLKEVGARVVAACLVGRAGTGDFRKDGDSRRSVGLQS